MRKTFLTLIVVLFSIACVKAVEGMWLPSLIHKNIEEMQAMGLEITAEDLYSEDGASLKDAIVRFGRGCTGAFISGQGLLITNHHCGYGQIQRHSSVENDYLTEGFWASNADEELPNEGLTITLLVRMVDVTQRVLEATEPGMDELRFQEAVAKASRQIADEAKEEGLYEAQVNPFYFGNEYYLFVYKVYRDVRMVGAPPSSVGKFGGDTDNWMWPRHTGDFMLFRVYADDNNQPADYSPDNVPYQPEKFFPVSARTLEPHDFTMVYGFPGRTNRYLTSDAVQFIMEQENPMGIKLRTDILQIYDQHMASSDKVRIQYASKHAGVANAWKRWIGENRGLKRLNAIEVKKAYEQEFEQWIQENPSKGQAYEDLLSEFHNTYMIYNPLRYSFRLYFEAGRNVEVNRFAQQFMRLVSLSRQKDVAEDVLQAELEQVKDAARRFFKDYHAPIDQQVLSTLTRHFISLSQPGMLPPELEKVRKKYGMDTEKFAEDVFSRSMFVSEEKTMKLLDNYRPSHHRRIERDPAYRFAAGLFDFTITEVQTPMQEVQNKLDSLYRVYTAALKKMQPDENFFPDANGTLRISYGRVEGSFPRNGIQFLPFTTSEGILEKAAEPDVEDYTISERLSTLLKNQVFGEYASGEDLRVNFISSNHTTGGNSGSPVLDGQGNFIGINFDRSWESTMSDIMFDPEQCRNISVSSQYILWVIHKYAGMEYLLDEMEVAGLN
ncbi:MAG: S46 family peptidase [Bacteroidetes bacterium]|nr:MAG: S46 family peptidase [Bacteroidota bacterium]